MNAFKNLAPRKPKGDEFISTDCKKKCEYYK